MAKRPRIYWWAVLAIGPLILSSCRAEEVSVELGPEPATRETYFSISLGNSKFEAQLAVTSSEMSRGLMHRKSLGKNRGMLFVYEKADQLSFWMRNTFIPLDIGFFDSEGRLREIRQMYPHDETSVRSRDESIQFALETNMGWFKEKNLLPGVKIDLVAVASALRARGFDPTRYQLPKSP